MKISSVSEMRELDRTAIERYGIPEEILMENAGLAAAAAIRETFGVRGRTFVIFCGIGNNGGDGFVVARKLHSNGGRPKVFILGDPERFKGSADKNLRMLPGLGVAVERLESPDAVKGTLAHADAVVDAIFGTGLDREVGGIYADVIGMINESGKRVFSLDIPSGVHGDTGRVMGVAVRADCTVTFGLPKAGNLLYPGYERCGRLYVTHISFPPVLTGSDELKMEINPPPVLPPRDRAGHKGTFGNALVIAGAAGYYGAPYYAALSFLKAGGGYARLAAPAAITPFIANKGSEIVFVPQKETPSGGISPENRESLLALSERMDVVILGPGLSTDPGTRQLARDLANGIWKPLIVDGDGIRALAGAPDILRQREGETVLTPHLGEMSALAGLEIPEVDRDKVAVLRRTAAELDATIVLKGAHSLVGDPEGRVFVNMSGNSGMATAGSGDVLTGAVAAMYCLGKNVPDAVRNGVFVHGLAGDLAAESKGEDGITAQDILEYLPLAVREVREGLAPSRADRYAGARLI
ncbi:MAG: bifunctional ADP-dependent NAD(P)H-hydrate dehydratase/NAD(P)H-hydrate epimerase [Deltaproteobacteria bacterium]|nr:MAG: bifunctional ADP-dependent NAD(P)H-hydrate dehydratase/NAD(P)H-hydrate epimerase [Deltaproteobacteria bacterium]